MSKGKKKTKKSKKEVRHYGDYYKKDLQCIYRTESKKDEYGFVKKVEVMASELDKQWANPGKTFVKVVSDGNGYDVTVADKKMRINYDEAWEMMLAFHVAAGDNSAMERIK